VPSSAVWKGEPESVQLFLRSSLPPSKVCSSPHFKILFAEAWYCLSEKPSGPSTSTTKQLLSLCVEVYPPLANILHDLHRMTCYCFSSAALLACPASTDQRHLVFHFRPRPAWQTTALSFKPVEHFRYVLAMPLVTSSLAVRVILATHIDIEALCECHEEQASTEVEKAYRGHISWCSVVQWDQ
jgi:hypothetical protein